MTALVLVPDVGDTRPQLPPIERYAIWMQGRGLSDRTITDTMLTLCRFQNVLSSPIESTPALAISRFLASERFGARTRYTYHGHLRGFFRWLAAEGGVDAMATLPQPRMPRGVPRPITDEELASVLALRMRRRTRVMILLAAYAGLRAHEIAKVRGQDVDLGARTVHVIGKGDHGAWIPLHPLLAEVAETMPRRGWWFPSHTVLGQPVRRESVTGTISKVFDRAGIHGATHRLRHWFGTSLVDSGADLRTAQTLLRHENLASTAIYTAVRDERRVEAVARLVVPGGARG